MSRSRPTYIVFAIAIGLGLGLVLAELAIRVHRYGFDSLLPSVMNSLHPIGTSGMIRRSIPELGYELKPNLDELYKKVPFQTNSVGLRDREYALRKPENTFRVAVIGDSFTMPTGVLMEEAYHSRLEDSLNGAAGERGSAQRYEFLNFGVGGYQLPQYFAILRERALAYQPDLVLIGLSTNDHIFFQSIADKFNEPYRVKEETFPFFELELGPWLERTLRRGPAQRPSQTLLTPVFRAHVDEYFGRLNELAESADVSIVVVFLAPYRWQFGELREGLLSVAEKHGPAFIDARESLPEQVDFGLRIFRADGHPNGAANALFAETIEQRLLEQGLVPEP